MYESPIYEKCLEYAYNLRVEMDSIDVRTCYSKRPCSDVAETINQNLTYCAYTLLEASANYFCNGIFIFLEEILQNIGATES